MSELIKYDKNEVIENLRRNILKGANNTQVEMFLVFCDTNRFHPLSGKVVFIKDKNYLTIDAYREMAERSGQYAGQDGPYWCDNKGEWFDIWPFKTNPYACKVGIYRKGFDKPMYSIAKWDEFGSTNFTWKKMPSHMLSIRAESLALRKAFPSVLGGTYTKEEMFDEPTVKDVTPPQEMTEEPKHEMSMPRIVNKIKETIKPKAPKQEYKPLPKKEHKDRDLLISKIKQLCTDLFSVTPEYGVSNKEKKAFMNKHLSISSFDDLNKHEKSYLLTCTVKLQDMVKKAKGNTPPPVNYNQGMNFQNMEGNP